MFSQYSIRPPMTPLSTRSEPHDPTSPPGGPAPDPPAAFRGEGQGFHRASGVSGRNGPPLGLIHHRGVVLEHSQTTTWLEQFFEKYSWEMGYIDCMFCRVKGVWCRAG